MVFSPIADMFSSIRSFIPLPSATMAMTAATPMMIPSMVRGPAAVSRARERQAMRRSMPSLLMAQRLYRIQPRRFQRGIEAEEYPDGD